MPREQLVRAEMRRFLGHTYNIPLYKMPQPGKLPLGSGPAADYRPRHDLYDLAADPGQAHHLDDSATEARLCAILREHYARPRAPEEQWARLGL